MFGNWCRRSEDLVMLESTTWRLVAASALLVVTQACAHGAAGQASDAPPRGAGAVARQVAGTAQAPRLDHVSPSRDSQGSVPRLFEWTAVPGADSYSIGVWNEVDMLIWRQDRIPGNSFDSSQSLRLEPGTYFWAISALREGEEIASSGLSAFVVRPTNP